MLDSIEVAVVVVVVVAGGWHFAECMTVRYLDPEGSILKHTVEPQSFALWGGHHVHPS